MRRDFFFLTNYLAESARACESVEFHKNRQGVLTILNELNPMRDKNEGTYVHTGDGRREDTCDDGYCYRPEDR